jgi:hypothetical protein
MPYILRLGYNILVVARCKHGIARCRTAIAEVNALELTFFALGSNTVVYLWTVVLGICIGYST